MRVHYKYFEQDDPQFYLSKVKYIEENDVSNLEMTFSEEEYSADGQLLRVNPPPPPLFFIFYFLFIFFEK